MLLGAGAEPRRQATTHRDIAASIIFARLVGSSLVVGMSQVKGLTIDELYEEEEAAWAHVGSLFKDGEETRAADEHWEVMVDCFKDDEGDKEPKHVCMYARVCACLYVRTYVLTYLCTNVTHVRM